MMQTVNNTHANLTEAESLANFRKSLDGMVASNDAFNDSGSSSQMRKSLGESDKEAILRTIESGSLNDLRTLSCQYVNTNSYYKQILTHYATLLDYAGILIPNVAYQKSLQDSKVNKRYIDALDLIENMKLKDMCTKIAFTVLRDGAYYGAIKSAGSSNAFTLMDLPFEYCRSRFQDEYGNALVEFDVRYFDNLKRRNSGSDFDLMDLLSTFPIEISKYYKKYTNARTKPSPWVLLPNDKGIAFFLFDKRPYFLSIIPSLVQYEDSVDTELERQVNEISKILCNRVPNTSDGSYLMEPPEAETFHKGVVKMITPKNKHLSVLTTFTDSEILDTSTTNNVTNNTLDNMRNNIYSSAGVSGELFNSSGSSSIPYSLNDDIALMMVLAKKIQIFIGSYVTKRKGNGNIFFTYQILPVTNHNRDKYVNSSFKLASSGYSFLVPAVAQGLSQRDLVNLKNLENDFLKMDEILKPLSSSYTQSGKESKEPEGNKGRPTLNPGEETEKTIENKKSKEKTGGQ